MQKRRIRHDNQIWSVDFPTHIDLFGDTGENLLQGLVYGIDRDDPIDFAETVGRGSVMAAATGVGMSRAATDGMFSAWRCAVETAGG